MFTENITIKDVKVKTGKLVRLLRKREKISQDELAEKLGISRITVANMEAGKNFTIDSLLKVLRHFELLGEVDRLLDERIGDNEGTGSLY